MRAIFPGSFDPLTNGHLDIILRGKKLFDQLTVAIMPNSQKNALFSLDEKTEIVKDAVKDYPNVDVVTMEAGLTVEKARQLGATVILRGLRNTTDFEYEQQTATMNHALDDQLETVFLPCLPATAAISSSLVKEIARFHGDISKFVPQKSRKMLEVKFNV